MLVGYHAGVCLTCLSPACTERPGNSLNRGSCAIGTHSSGGVRAHTMSSTLLTAIKINGQLVSEAEVGATRQQCRLV